MEKSFSTIKHFACYQRYISNTLTAVTLVSICRGHFCEVIGYRWSQQGGQTKAGPSYAFLRNAFMISKRGASLLKTNPCWPSNPV